ncbi:MAG TPA: nickel pincer cofactor biosynthesis protein LarC [Acidobacteriaceae bacterium]|nr:nickel pincer cofactor biosynthesis protein LarC [Acidobacteriaceae bacterium]
MRLAYLECFAGASGDMFLGALLDAGVPASVLEEAVLALDIGASLRIEKVDRSGIAATKVHVLEHGQVIEETHEHHHLELPQQHTHTHTHATEKQHLHKSGHHHEHHDEHPHAHTHGRSLGQIRTLISSAALDSRVQRLALRTFELLGAAEATIHNVPVDEIHFHEVGGVDAIVDIVGSCAGIVHLNVGRWYASPLNVGGGMIDCAHGRFPVPAPATAELLRGMPTYSAHVQKELLTPTGAALLRALEPTFGPQPAMRADRIGYGAGTRNPAGFPNVLRLTVSETSSDEQSAANSTDEVMVIETALDDCSPQILAFVSERSLALGALDVMLMPVQMKKGRPGTLVAVLCTPGTESTFAELLFRETSTLGIRTRREARLILDREIITVETPYGRIRIKRATKRGETRNLAPEFEDCRAAAEHSGVTIKEVQQAALRAAAAYNP